MKVSVVYALPRRALVMQLELDADATAGDAIRLALARAGIAVDASFSVGVHGRAVSPQHALHEGDRVEVYRPLQVDAKQLRRRRAAVAAMKPR